MMPMQARLDVQGQKVEEEELFTPNEDLLSSQGSVHSISSAATIAVPLAEEITPLYCTRCGPRCLDRMMAPLYGPGMGELQCSAEHGCMPRCCEHVSNPGEEPELDKAWEAVNNIFFPCEELCCDAFGCSSCMVENTAGGATSEWYCGKCFFGNLPRLPVGWSSDPTRKLVKPIWERQERMCWPDCRRQFEHTERDIYTGAPPGALRCNECNCWCCSQCMVRTFDRDVCPGCLLNKHNWHPLTQHLAENKLFQS